MNNISTTNTKVFLEAVAQDKAQVKTISSIVFFRRILGIGERVDLSEVMKGLQRYAMSAGKSVEFQKRFISNSYAGEVITFDIGNDPAWMQFKVVREPLPDDAASTAINFLVVVTDINNHKRYTRLIGAISKETKPDNSGTVSVLRTIDKMTEEEDLPVESNEENLKNLGDEEPVVEATQSEETPATQVEVKEEAKPEEEPKKEEVTKETPGPSQENLEEQKPDEVQTQEESVVPAEESEHNEEEQPEGDHEGDENAESSEDETEEQEEDDNVDESETTSSIPDIDNNEETSQDNGDSAEEESDEETSEEDEDTIIVPCGMTVEFKLKQDIGTESSNLTIITCPQDGSERSVLVEMQGVRGVTDGKYTAVVDFTNKVLNTSDINKVMECFAMEQKKEEVKAVGEIPITTLCKDEHKDYEYLEMLFGTPNPSILHVINRIKSAQEKSPSMEYELTGSFPIEQMICFSDYSFSIVRMKSGSYYRIFVAHTDLARGADGCWLKTNDEKDRWFMIGNVNDRDVDMINKRRR